MYTIFIPKYQNESTDYLITKVINLYMKNSCCNCIISSPGYMSTTLKTIKFFVNELGNRMSKNTPYIGFFNGTNGSTSLYGHTIREEHEDQVVLSSKFNLLPICCRPIKDHRKMMFFINIDWGSIPQKLNKENYKNFLDHCKVYGMLLGSSNQSLQTYFGGINSSSADKGEADILMYTDDNKKIVSELMEFQSSNNNNNNNINIRISKSIDEENYDDYRDSYYLKNILNNFLEINLDYDNDSNVKFK